MKKAFDANVSRAKPRLRLGAMMTATSDATPAADAATVATVEALAKATGNPRFAWDCYRRFVQMYGDVVLGVQKQEGEDDEPFETVIHKYKQVTPTH